MGIWINGLILLGWWLLPSLLWAFPGARVAPHDTVTVMGVPAEPFYVTGTLTTLTGGDNLNVDIPMDRQIKAFFLKKNAAASDMMFRTDAMPGDATINLHTAGGFIANCIQSLGVGTVQLGNNPACNASSATFYYLALSDLSGDIDVDIYTGTGSAHNESLNAAWTPGLVIVGGNTAASKIWATPSTLAVSSQSCHFPNNACTTNHVTSLNAGTFGVGTLGTVNTDGTTYAYFAMNVVASTGLMFDHASRVGNGSDNQTITFGNGTTETPVFVVIAQDQNEDHGYRFGSQTGDASFLGLAAASADCIQGFSAGSWSLGSSANCNQSSIAGYWWGIGQ